MVSSVRLVLVPVNESPDSDFLILLRFSCGYYCASKTLDSERLILLRFMNRRDW